MAATVDRKKVKRDWPYLIREVRMSVIVSDQPEDVVHGGPTGKNCDMFTWEITTPPTFASAVSVYHDEANDSASGGTARIIVVCADPAGMVIKLRFHFYSSASGGIDASNATA